MHICPDCGQSCYCNGDIDDIECDPTASDRCNHCVGITRPGNDDFDADDFAQIEAEIAQEMDDMIHNAELDGLRMSLEERCKNDGHYGYRTDRLYRWFHVFKLFVCWLLRRHWHSGYGNHPDVIMTALIYHRPTYAGWEEQWIEVGEGVFRNWFYQVQHDSDWTM